jgi:predicted transcriptional regulator
MYPMLAKILAVALLLGIIISLGSGLLYLIKDQGESERAVKALTIRVALSVGLFVMFLIAAFTGLISPHGIVPN